MRRSPRDVDVAVRAEEVEEILERPPAALLRAVPLLALLATALATLIASQISYPDFVPGRVTVVRRAPPVPVVIRLESRLVDLPARDGARVDEGDVIGVLESDARHEDALRLLHRVRTLTASARRVESFTIDDVPDAGELGSLEAPYAEVRRAVAARSAYAAGNRNTRQRASLARRAAAQATLETSLLRQLALGDSQRELSRAGLASAETLAGEALATQPELRLERRRVLDDELERERRREAMARNAAERAALVGEVAGVAQAHDLEVERLTRDLRVSWSSLRGAVAAWDHTHVLRAPVTGKVSLLHVWSRGQVLKPGAEAIFVVPESGALIGRVTVSQRGLGKVRVGQRAVVRLDGFPEHEFGVVRAQVEALPENASGDDATLVVGFPYDLTTASGRRLAFTPGLAGSISVVTAERSLLTRCAGVIRYFGQRAREGGQESR